MLKYLHVVRIFLLSVIMIYNYIFGESIGFSWQIKKLRVYVVHRLARRSITDFVMWRHVSSFDDIILYGSKWLAYFILDFEIMKR